LAEGGQVAGGQGGQHSILLPDSYPSFGIRDFSRIKALIRALPAKGITYGDFISVYHIKIGPTSWVAALDSL